MSNISCVFYELHFVRNSTIQVTFFLPSVSKALANDRAHLVECNLIESNFFGQKGKCISTSCIDLIRNPEDINKLPNTNERFDSISPDAHDMSSPGAHIPYSICSLNRPIWLLCTFEFIIDPAMFNINSTTNNVINNTISIKFNFECDWRSYYDLHKLYYPSKPVYHKKYTSNGRINLAINCIKNIKKSVFFMSQYRQVMNDNSSREASADDELNTNCCDINSCKDINNKYDDELGKGKSTSNNLYDIEYELYRQSKNKFLSKKITKKFKKNKSSNKKKSSKNIKYVKRYRSYQENRFCKKNKNNNFVIMRNYIIDAIEINQLLKQGESMESMFNLL